MLTPRVNLEINQGAAWSYVVTHRDSAGAAIDLTPFSGARMHIKEFAGAPPIAILHTDAAEQDGGSLALGGANGQITMAMTTAEAESILGELNISYPLIFDPQRKQTKIIRCIYDLELLNGTEATRIFEGAVYISREATE